MWATFDKSNLPLVNVKLNGEINAEYFNDFIAQWVNLLQKKEQFYFIFNTENCGYINVKYLFKIAVFIKKIKALPEQYLQRSIIMLNNSALRSLLKLLFSIQSPSAPVYVCRTMEDAYIVNGLLIENKPLPNGIMVYK